MTLSHCKTRSTSLALQEASPTEHAIQPTGTQGTSEHEAEEEGQAEDDQIVELPPDSVWRRSLTVEEEEFFRDIEIAVQGMEPGTLERWIQCNEVKYDRKHRGHWRNHMWNNGWYRDQRRARGESSDTPECMLAAYRTFVLDDLEDKENVPPVVVEPVADDAPRPSPVMSSQDTTREYSPEVPVAQPAAAETSQSAPQAGATAMPSGSQGPYQHEVPGANGPIVRGAEEQRQATIALLQQEYSATVGLMQWLVEESKKPHPEMQVQQMLQEWRSLDNILASLRDHLRWYSMFEAGNLHMYTLIALGMTQGLPSTANGSVRDLSLGAQPGAVPGINGAGFGAHSGYRFGAPANSARK